MEASLTRKDSKRHGRKEETGVESSAEERIKDKKQRKKKDGKRKKKRSSVPDSDEVQTLGKDNNGLEHDESIGLARDRANIIGAEAGIDESRDSTNVQSRDIESQERLNSSVSRDGTQVQPDHGLDNPIATGFHAGQDQATDVASEGTGALPQTGQVISREGSAKSEQGLRRRATLTEIGQSFDEDQAVDPNEVSYSVNVFSDAG